MSTPNPLEKTKGAGTTFWMYTGMGDPFCVCIVRHGLAATGNGEGFAAGRNDG